MVRGSPGGRKGLVPAFSPIRAKAEKKRHFSLENATVAVHIYRMDGETRYGIEELAQLGGVSRRTIRYYIQEGLLPPPLGVGRGRHYGKEHLERLIAVRGMQESGRTLEEIRAAPSGEPEAASRAAPLPEPSRETWIRIILADGLELHLSSSWKTPSPGKLSELSSWCHGNIRREGEN